MDEIKQQKQNLLTKEAVAAALEVSISTVDRLINNGTLKTVSIGKRKFIDKAEVEALLRGAKV